MVKPFMLVFKQHTKQDHFTYWAVDLKFTEAKNRSYLHLKTSDFHLDIF